MTNKERYKHENGYARYVTKNFAEFNTARIKKVIRNKEYYGESVLAAAWKAVLTV